MTAPLRQPSRVTFARSALYDALVLAGWLAVSAAAAMGWIVARSSGGAVDLAEADAQIAAALVLAALPAWFAWYGNGVIEGRTRGQVRTGLHVEGSTRRRLVRFAAHPLAIPVWVWLGLVALAAGLPWVGVAILVVTVALGLGALGTLLGWLLLPGTLAIHDRLAGTRLVEDREGQR